MLSCCPSWLSQAWKWETAAAARCTGPAPPMVRISGARVWVRVWEGSHAELLPSLAEPDGRPLPPHAALARPRLRCAF